MTPKKRSENRKETFQKGTSKIVFFMISTFGCCDAGRGLFLLSGPVFCQRLLADRYRFGWQGRARQTKHLPILLLALCLCRFLFHIMSFANVLFFMVFEQDSLRLQHSDVLPWGGIWEAELASGSGGV